MLKYKSKCTKITTYNLKTTPSVPICLFCLKSQTFLGNIIYCLVCLIKIYKFLKLLLNKFIIFFKRVILNVATKNVSQLDDFLKYLLVFFSNSFENKVEV